MRICDIDMNHDKKFESFYFDCSETVKLLLSIYIIFILTCSNDVELFLIKYVLMPYLCCNGSGLFSFGLCLLETKEQCSLPAGIYFWFLYNFISSCEASDEFLLGRISCLADRHVLRISHL